MTSSEVVTQLVQKYTEQELVHFCRESADPLMRRLYSRALEHYEPILDENNDRFVLFPIKYNEPWSMYKKAEGSFWTAAEIKLSDDLLQWRDASRLDNDTRYFIKQILAFFAGMDNIINENLASRFYKEIQIPEIRAFYGFQLAIEQIHSEVYSQLIDTYIELQTEKDFLLNGLKTIPCIKKMADWALKWIDSDSPFSERLIAFACVEAIMFSGPFCAIYWLKKRNILPGLAMANELIARDEALHAEFACLVNSLLKYPANETVILQIITEAVELEINFINESIPCRLIGMNSDTMSQYIKFIADRLLQQLNCSRYYQVSNPYPWMELISVDSKNNFFERDGTEYSRAGYTSKGAEKKGEIQVMDDF